MAEILGAHNKSQDNIDIQNCRYRFFVGTNKTNQLLYRVTKNSSYARDTTLVNFQE